MTKDIRPDLLKQLRDLAESAWDREMLDANAVFTQPEPYFDDWKLQSKRAEAWMEWKAKSDSAKLRKIALLKQLALLQSNQIPGEMDDQMSDAAGSMAVIDFLEAARKRIK